MEFVLEGLEMNCPFRECLKILLFLVSRNKVMDFKYQSIKNRVVVLGQDYVLLDRDETFIFQHFLDLIM